MVVNTTKVDRTAQMAVSWLIGSSKLDTLPGGGEWAGPFNIASIGKDPDTLTRLQEL